MFDDRTQIGLDPAEQARLDAAYARIAAAGKPAPPVVPGRGVLRLVDRVLHHNAA